MTTSDIRVPSPLALGLVRATVELKTFLREKNTVIFTFSLPIIMLLILGSVFTDVLDGTPITVSQLFVGGMVLFSTAFAIFCVALLILGSMEDPS